MKKLLERWAELAPEECEPTQRGPKGADRFLVKSTSTHQDIICIPMFGYMKAIILYAVLMCWKANDWQWDRSVFHSGRVRWFLYLPDSNVISYGEREGAEIANVVLSLHIKALEASK